MAELANIFVLDELKSAFPEDILMQEEPYGLLTIVLKAGRLRDVLQFLSAHPDIQTQFLTDLCGSHYPDNKDGELCMVYHMYSMTKNYRIRIKCFIPISNPVIASIADLFPAANWQERETFDFYGVLFEGHPNLTRIMNVEEMDYFPLRKEYPLEDGTRTDKTDNYFGR